MTNTLNTLKNAWKVLPIGSLAHYQNRIDAGEVLNQRKTLAHELYALLGTAYLLGMLAYGPFNPLKVDFQRDNLENKIAQVEGK